MEDGEVRQVGSQQALYERPANRFVAGFVGRSTFIEGVVQAGGQFHSAGGLALRCDTTATGPATLALRPERVACGTAPLTGMENDLPGVVEFVSYLGAMIDLHVRVSPAERIIAQIPNRADVRVPQVGEQVHVGWPARDGIVFAGAASAPHTA
jgi:putative spermidine/putrescine transport system ATP-binding protein